MTPKTAAKKKTPKQKQSIKAINAKKVVTWDDIHRNALKSPFHWILTFFPEYVPFSFSTFHVEFWVHVWTRIAGLPIQDTAYYDQGPAWDERPPAWFSIWPRGAAKTTTAEIAVVMLGSLGVKKYCLYVSETQAQANDHISNIGAHLEAHGNYPAIYPGMAKRLVGKYGSSKGWRRSRMRTATGFSVDAIGLDTAARGVKLESDRPDLMIFDDLDSEMDTPDAADKKVKALTTKLIPAGSRDLAILAIQNLPNNHGIFARVAHKFTGAPQADYLADRIVSGPIPALNDLAYEWDPQEGRYKITKGEPNWDGQDVETCQNMIDDMGITAFLSECQHEFVPEGGGMFDHLEYDHAEYKLIEPSLQRVVCWVDPAVSKTDKSDAMGIQIDGMDEKGHIYRLFSWEQRSTPLNALIMALNKAKQYKAEKVGIETDQGGDTWMSVFREAVEATGIKLPMDAIKAGGSPGGKTHRASQMLVDYETGNITHCLGTHSTLEHALNRFPRMKPFDLVDAAFWSWWDLVTMRPDDDVVEMDMRQEISPV